MNGLIITEEFITPEYEQELIKNILNSEWDTSISRRTQQYGYKYNYKSRDIKLRDYLGSFPEWLDKLVDYLVDKTSISRPTQVIINEYEPGQGIAPHIDSEIFDDHICSLSLNDGIIMDFQDRYNTYHIHLKNRSLLEMTNEARYLFTHSIASRKTDIINGMRVRRNVRYSITFRRLA